MPADDGLQGLHGALIGSRCAAAANNNSLQVSQALAVALRPLCQLLSCGLSHRQRSHSSPRAHACLPEEPERRVW